METSVNNKCKAFTSLGQSKKLAEILPLESADMSYQHFVPEFGLEGYCISLDAVEYDDDIPCWSLAALLGVLPEGTRLLKSATDNTCHCDCPKGNIDKWFDNPVDACYELILKLHELNLL